MEILFPTEIGDTPTCTTTAGSNSGMSCFKQDAFHIQIPNINNYAAGSQIYFQVKFGLNPKNIIKLSEINLLVWTVSQTRDTIYHKSLIPLSDEGYYEPRALNISSISGRSVQAATRTTYKFKINNNNFALRQNALIKVVFPIELKFVHRIPVLTNLVAIDTSAICSPVDADNSFVIRGAFPLSTAPLTIEFEVLDILNPYFIGFTSTFNTSIYEFDDINQMLFTMKTEYTINISAPGLPLFKCNPWLPCDK